MASRTLAPGEDPPGKWVLDERTGMRVWSGDHDWSTRHGDATVHWSLGRAMRVDGARTDEGVMLVQTVSPLERDTWRRRSPAMVGGWIHGRIDIAEDGVTFTDVPRMTLSEAEAPDPDGPPHLGYALAGDGAFLGRLQDVGFAHAVYASMCNASFRQGDHHRRWSISWRGAGDVVATLRDLGESYIDFYCADWRLADGQEPSPEVRDRLLREVDGHYARLGWRRLGQEELAEDHARAVADIVTAESRPEGPRPAWAERFSERGRRLPSDRAVMAALTGCLSEDEFDSICERLDFKEEQAASVDFLVAAMGGEEERDEPPGPRLQ